ncbi:MAG: hypothetical protein EXR80_04340 [Methylococcales bacterium]|nr:hypothetical protein [Methylococcales bacterium]
MASVEDKTQEIITYLQDRLNGYRVEKGLTTFSDYVNDFGVGYKDKARGSGNIVTTDFASGSIQKIDVGVSGIPVIWTADIIFNIRYEAKTHGERRAYPGDVLLDNIWNSVSSAGTIVANLKMAPRTHALLTLDVNVNPDTDNRPGDFVKDYITPLFRDAIDNTLEQFTDTQIN